MRQMRWKSLILDDLGLLVVLYFLSVTSLPVSVYNKLISLTRVLAFLLNAVAGCVQNRLGQSTLQHTAHSTAVLQPIAYVVPVPTYCAVRQSVHISP